MCITCVCEQHIFVRLGSENFVHLLQVCNSIGKMDWAKYLADGVNSKIYHICEVTNFQHQILQSDQYFPPTFEQDGFVHCSSSPKQLVDIGNYFYKSAPGDWICLCLWTHKLKDVRFESPAPVGNVTRVDDANSVIKFPHIYGPITKESICAVYNVVRSADDGSFLRIVT